MSNKYWWLQDRLDVENKTKETLKVGLLSFLTNHFPESFPTSCRLDEKLLKESWSSETKNLI